MPNYRVTFGCSGIEDIATYDVFDVPSVVQAESKAIDEVYAPAPGAERRRIRSSITKVTEICFCGSVLTEQDRENTKRDGRSEQLCDDCRESWINANQDPEY